MKHTDSVDTTIGHVERHTTLNPGTRFDQILGDSISRRDRTFKLCWLTSKIFTGLVPVTVSGWPHSHGNLPLDQSLNLDRDFVAILVCRLCDMEHG
jgi:hypothetical protein